MDSACISTQAVSLPGLQDDYEKLLRFIHKDSTRKLVVKSEIERIMERDANAMAVSQRCVYATFHMADSPRGVCRMAMTRGCSEF